jgi:hypothetical protein
MEDSKIGYYISFLLQFGIYTVAPSLFLTTPAYYFLKKRSMFTWYDVGLFLYGYSLWWLIELSYESLPSRFNFYHATKSLSNAAVEPTIISFSILILTS